MLLAASAWATFDRKVASLLSHSGKGLPPTAAIDSKVPISFRSPEAMLATRPRAPVMPRQSTETKRVLAEYLSRSLWTSFPARIDFPIPLSPVMHAIRLAASLSLPCSIASK